MTLDDSCLCGAHFTLRGSKYIVQKTWVTWLNIHATCRDDPRRWTLKEEPL